MIFGIILLVIGISIMLPKIPVFQIILGGFLVLLGVSMFLGKDFKSFVGISRPNLIVFNEGIFHYDEKQKEYFTIFGNTKLDLTNAKYTTNKKLEIINIFGNTEITLNKNSNFRIKATTVFGSSNLPNNKKEGFGDTTIESSNFDKSKPYLDLELITVFGSVNASYNGGTENAFWIKIWRK